MTKADLADKIHSTTSLSRKDSLDMLERHQAPPDAGKGG